MNAIEPAAWADPPLTTIEQPIEEIAFSAVDALRAMIDNPRRTFPRLLFRPKLREGGTTAAPLAA